MNDLVLKVLDISLEPAVLEGASHLLKQSWATNFQMFVNLVWKGALDAQGLI